jgi:methyl-accepting chemotaxis protein
VADNINEVGQLAEGISAGNTQIKISADNLSVLSQDLKDSIDKFRL